MEIERPAGWEFVHERQNDLIRRDGWMCEQHPGTEWPHDDCAGPGMPWIVEGKQAIVALRVLVDVLVEAKAAEYRDHATRRLSPVAEVYTVVAHELEALLSDARKG